MFTSKELRGNNSMLGKVQRQQDCCYNEKLKSFDKLKYDLKDSKEKTQFKQPIKIITKGEIGNKRSLLR